MKEESKASRITRLKREAGKRKPGIPSLISALEFRREAYELTATEFAEILNIGRSHYSEFVNGKRGLPKEAMRRAYRIGVPPCVLLEGVV